MTVYPRRRAHIVPELPRRLRRPLKHPEKETAAMKMIVATMKCGRVEYQARLPLPTGATKDPHAMHRIKLQLKLMLAEQVVKGEKVTYEVEKPPLRSVR